MLVSRNHIAKANLASPEGLGDRLWSCVNILNPELCQTNTQPNQGLEITG